MKIRHLLGFVIIAAMASCSKEEMGENALTNFVLKATVDNSTPTSRAGFDSNAKFYWSKNDQMGVTTTNSPTSFSALTLQGDGGSATGTFSGDIYGNISGYAVYPHNSNHKINEGTLTYQFPATYEYTSVDTEYFHTSDQGKANSFNFAMWGKIENGSVGMKHLGGVFMVAFTSIPAEGTFILSTDQKLNGTYSVGLTTTTPEIKINDEDTPEDTEKQVTISYKGATDGQVGVFYVPAPTGDYTNVTATIKNTTGDIVKQVACGNIEIKRAYGKILNFTNGSISGGEAFEAEDVAGANKALENENITSVKISALSGGETITIPAKSSSEIAEVSHAIDLSNATLPTEGNITINVAEGSDGTNTVEKLTVVVPTGTESTGKFIINAPGTTVTIQAADGTVIETIEATTADNTLIIGEGVTVKNLTIKKGNVELYGKLEKFTSEVSTTIKLMKDIDLTSEWQIEQGMNVTLDLNGYTLAVNYVTNHGIDNYGTLNIKGNNGKMTWVTTDYGNNAVYCIVNRSGATMTIDACEVGGPVYNYGDMTIGNGSKLITDAADRGALLCGSDTQAIPWTFTMTGGSIISKQHTAAVVKNNYVGLESPGLAKFSGVTFEGTTYHDIVLWNVNIEWENCTLVRDNVWLCAEEYVSYVNGNPTKKENLQPCKWAEIFPVTSEE